MESSHIVRQPLSFLSQSLSNATASHIVFTLLLEVLFLQ